MSSSRRLARTFIGVATLAPGLALLALGVALAARGGGPGAFAGVFVGLLGLGLAIVAFLMMRAPGAAIWFLRHTEAERAARDERRN